MRQNLRRVFEALSRCVRLRCPACGLAPVFQAPFRRKSHCSSCGVTFEREEGYFVGAVAINLVVTEIVILAAHFILLLTVGYNEQLTLTVVLPLALLFPLVFYHFSWSAWLAFDNFFERLPKQAGRRKPVGE